MFNTGLQAGTNGAPKAATPLEKGGPSSFTVVIDFPIETYRGKSREEIAYAVDRSLEHWRVKALQGLYDATRTSYSAIILGEIKRWDACGRLIDRIVVSKDVMESLFDEIGGEESLWSYLIYGTNLAILGYRIERENSAPRGSILFVEKIR